MSDFITMTPNPATPPNRRSGGCAIFSIFIGLIIVGSTVLGIGAAVLSIAAPDTLSQILGGLSGLPVKQSQAITGDPSHFDPIKSFAEARDFAAKDAQLTKMTISYVRSDGTLDLTATYKPAPQVEYDFVEPVPTPTNAPPPGAGGNTSAQWYLPITITAYQPGQNERIRESGGNGSIDYQFINKGYSRETDTINNDTVTILPAPTCDLAQLWQTAIQTANAQSNAVATIQYDASGYDFSITGTFIDLKFDTNCQPTAN